MLTTAQLYTPFHSQLVNLCKTHPAWKFWKCRKSECTELLRQAGLTVL